MSRLIFRLALPLLPYREPQVLCSCSDLGAVIEKENIRSVLIVTDKGVVANGLTSPVEKALSQSGAVYTVYDETCQNPTVKNVEEALCLYKENSCSAIVAVGGGSAMDCAKALGARVAYPKRSVGQMKGILRVLRPIPTLIAVPTTAGTGSEVTLAAVISDSERHHKYALMSFPLIPHYAVLDARLTYTLPQSLTATTGMDALTHAVEAYIGRSTTKKTRSLALESARLIYENIERACEEPKDREARENMLLAAYKAGVAFSQSYVGYIHAVAHSLGGQYGTPHGLANAVIMPYVLRSYAKSAEKKLWRMGVAVGACSESDSYREGAERFILSVERLNERIGIPKKLSGIRKEDIPIMAKHAEKEANPLYPVPKLMTWKELSEFYYKIADRSKK